MSSIDRTLVVRLDGGQDRDVGDNPITMIVAADDLVRAPSFKHLFLLNYSRILAACGSFRRPGVVVIAVDSVRRRVAGSLFLGARQDRANAAIIGRHSRAELYLDGDPSVSLRHLALVTHALDGAGEVCYRLLDLRTPRSFSDEHGRMLEALVAEGPVFVSCGRYALFFLPTADEIPWPDDAEDGWACVPERVYLEQSDAEPDRWKRRALERRGRRGVDGGDRPVTLINTIAGPSRARRELLAEGEQPLGRLHIRTSNGEDSLVVGARAADEGIILGRYDRCDGDGPSRLAYRSISRVHLLVLRIGERLYAIDTASTNGSFAADSRGDSRQERELRIMPLDDEHEVVLAEDAARVGWEQSS